MTMLASEHRSRVRVLWNGFVGVLGGVLGLAPHLLHHVGLLAGTALVAGSGGTVLFAVIGLVASVPLLLRLYRRFGTWWAPVLGLIVFTAMFLVSAFVVGPQISGTNDQVPAPQNVNQDSHHVSLPAERGEPR